MADFSFTTNHYKVSYLITQTNPPAITVQPISQTDCYYNTVIFSVGFTSTGSVNYQWESNSGSGWVPYGIQGNTSTSPIKLSVANIGANGINLDGTLYHVIISDAYGTATSLPATLTVNDISGILPKATQTTICTDENFSFTVSTSGSPPLSHQWLKDSNPVSDGTVNGVTINGSDSPSLTVANALPSESGSYQVRIIFDVIDGVSVGKTCQTTSQLIRKVTVNPLPTAVLTSSAANNVQCDGQSITFTGSGGTNYNFRMNGSSVQNNTSDTYTTNSLVSGQTIDVIVTSAAGCIATSTGISIIVIPYPNPNPIVNN
jgi:hypothetical protein